MKEIPDTNLADLTQEASLELLAEQRTEARSKIKAMFQRVAGLSGDIKSKENELTKLRKKLDAAQAKLERVRNGDWSVLDSKDEPESPAQ